MDENTGKKPCAIADENRQNEEEAQNNDVINAPEEPKSPNVPFQQGPKDKQNSQRKKSLEGLSRNRVRLQMFFAIWPKMTPR